MATAAQIWDVPFTGSQRWVARFLPSLTDLAFLLPALILFCNLSGAQGLLRDSDTGWHLRVGEWILQHKAIPTVDFFSFTKAGQPWFAWEWGWDLLFGAIHSAWSLTGVVFVNVLFLGAVSVLLFRLTRRVCGNGIVALLFTWFAICGSTIHWLARPHLLSWIFFLTFAHLLLSAAQGRTKVLFYLPLLMLFWTNLHGSFFLGILLIAISAITPWIEVALEPGVNWRAAYRLSRPYLLCALACAAVTFLNPYTWHLHEHVIRHLRDSKLMDKIQEFQSNDFHHGPIVFFEIMLFLGLPAVTWCIHRKQWGGALNLLLWAHLALFAARNVPIYLLLATPWIARMSVDASKQLHLRPWLSKAANSINETARDFLAIERIERLHVASLLGILFILFSLIYMRPGFESQFDPKEFPASAVPVIERQNAKRIFTTDQWAGYLIYRLYPKTRTFVDGRSDFFGVPFLDRCLHIFNGHWDCKNDLRKFLVDMVIVAPDAPLSTVLKDSPDWHVLLDDGSVVVFAPSRPAQQQNIAAGDTNFSAVGLNGGSALGVRKDLQVRD